MTLFGKRRLKRLRRYYDSHDTSAELATAVRDDTVQIIINTPASDPHAAAKEIVRLIQQYKRATGRDPLA